MTIRRLVLVALAGCMLGACSSRERMEAAVTGVAHFHELLNAQDYARIHAEAHEDLRRATSEQQLTRFLSAVSAKLGAVTTSQQTTWNMNLHTSGTLVTLAYQTQFAKGSGTEQFVFKFEDDKPLLIRYDVNSSELITN